MVLADPDPSSPLFAVPLTGSAHGLQQLSRYLAPPTIPHDSHPRLDEATAVGYGDGLSERETKNQGVTGHAAPMAPGNPAMMEDDEPENAAYNQLVSDESAKPFQRWIRTLHKRNVRHREMLDCDADLAARFGEPYRTSSPPRRPAYHSHSSSESSFAFVAGARSASISVTNLSMQTHSRKDALRCSFRDQSRTDHSSRASATGPRISQDSLSLDKQTAVDAAVTERSLQRRRILEEIVSTEESYIGDVRFLMNVRVGIGGILLALTTDWTGLRHDSRSFTHHAPRATIIRESEFERHRGAPRGDSRRVESRPTSLRGYPSGPYAGAGPI